MMAKRTLSPLELARVITLDEAAERLSVSKRTLMRNHSDKIVQISKGRVGMRIRDVIKIGEQRGKGPAN